MSEGKFYLVDWHQSNGQHHLSLQKAKSISVSHNDLDEAKELLYETICFQYGDGEAHLELIANDSANHAQWYEIEPIASAWLKNQGATLYEKGICQGCDFPIGDRTDVLLESGNPLKNGVGYFSNTKPMIYYYSKALLDNISLHLDVTFVTQPILYKGQETDYVEILNLPKVNYQILKGQQPNSQLRTTFECNRCGRKSFASFDYEAIAEEDLIAGKVNFCQTNSLHFSNLVLNGADLAKLARKRVNHRFATEQVKTLNQDALYTPSTLPRIDKIDWR